MLCSFLSVYMKQYYTIMENMLTSLSCKTSHSVFFESRICHSAPSYVSFFSNIFIFYRECMTHTLLEVTI